MENITAYDNVINSRDIIERIEELQADCDELTELLALTAQCSDIDDWDDGVDLIRDTHFEAYARDLAEECGLIPAATKWPLTCIDWKQAASELQMDYTSVTFAGTDYWVRS